MYYFCFIFYLFCLGCHHLGRTPESGMAHTSLQSPSYYKTHLTAANRLLIQGVQGRNMEKITQALKEKADPNLMNTQDGIPLIIGLYMRSKGFLISEEGSLPILKKLLDNGLNPILPMSIDGDTLSFFMRHQYRQVVQTILPYISKVSLHNIPRDRPLLHRAICYKFPEVATLLVENGFDPFMLFAREDQQLTISFNEAIAKGYHSFIDQVLRSLNSMTIDRKRELLFQADGQGSIPLHYALKFHNDKVVKDIMKSVEGLPEQEKEKLLLQPDRDNRTSLHIAASCGQVGMIKRFVEKNISYLYEKNAFGDSPLALLLQTPTASLIKYVHQKKVPLHEQWIIKKDAEGNIVSKTPFLHHIISLKSEPDKNISEIISYLVYATSFPLFVEHRGKSAIKLAIEGQNRYFINFIVNHLVECKPGAITLQEVQSTLETTLPAYPEDLLRTVACYTAEERSKEEKSATIPSIQDVKSLIAYCQNKEQLEDYLRRLKRV